MADCKFCDAPTQGMRITVVGTGSADLCDACMTFVEPAARTWQVSQALTEGAAAMPKIKFDKTP